MKRTKYKSADIFAVARAAGVSISTVSRAFNHPELLRPATLKRIEDAVAATGYIRNRAAQAMHGRRSGTIGLIVPTIDHTIFGELIQQFAQEIESKGFSLLLMTHNYDLSKEYQLVRKLLEHRVDGIGLIGLDHLDATFDVLDIQMTPTVSMWNYSKHSRIECYGASNVQAGQIAAQHLLGLGHRKIGFVFPDAQGNDRTQDRRAGALAALRAISPSLQPAFDYVTTYDITSSKQDCMRLFQENSGFTAVLCSNDVVGMAAIYAAQELGLKVPMDFSIMGIGDFQGAAEIVPALSTVRIPAKSIGAQAGAALCSKISASHNDLAPAPAKLRVIQRDTTRCLI